MGYANHDMKNEYMQVIIEAEINEVVEAEPKESNDFYLYGIVTVVLGSIAAYGASYLIRGKTEEIVIAEGPVLIPVDDYSEQQESIVSEKEPETFSVVPGSQFSRQLMFVCENGCMKEFEVDENDEEVMCPHCGTLGDSPL